MSDKIVNQENNSFSLSNVEQISEIFLEAICNATNLKREDFIDQQEINKALRNLPELLQKVPSNIRNAGCIKICMAIAAGLFDGALNYAWNMAVVELRKKVKRFGLDIIPLVLDEEYSNIRDIENLKDSELIELSYKLNIISNSGYFHLQQCREQRNEFSAAHPSDEEPDYLAFLNFFNKICIHALMTEADSIGIDIRELIEVVKSQDLSDEQQDEWCDRINKSYNLQKIAVVDTMYGMYCDQNIKESTRVNIVNIFKKLDKLLQDGDIASSIIARHFNYAGKDEMRHKASKMFFEKLKLLSLLSNSERHAIIYSACKQLRSVHDDFNNFYTEPPFAQRLYEISDQAGIPDVTKKIFTKTVVTCSVGNMYGTSTLADTHYQKIIKNFTAKEIQIMLNLPNENCTVANRIKYTPRCKEKYISLVKLLDKSSVPTDSHAKYDEWVK